MTTLDMFARITKVDAAKRLVYGSLASEAVDKSNEVFDYESSKPFVEAWSGSISKATGGKSEGNLRVMHGKKVAGVFKSVVCNDETKSVDVCAHVIDDDEWKMVDAGAYTGFSVGGSYVKKWKAGEVTRYTAKPAEGSLVDNPCNPDATFTMVKSDGTEVLMKFTQVGALPAPAAPTDPTAADAAAPPAAPAYEWRGPVQKWVAKDGRLFDFKPEAKAHDEALAKQAAQAATPSGKLSAQLSALAGNVADLEKRAAGETTAAQPAAEPTPTATPPAPAAPASPLAKKDYTPDERTKMAASGEAMTDGQYPIANKDDLGNAIQAFGRAKNKKAVKAHIIKRAKALDAEDQLPNSWKDGADKAVVFGDLHKGLGDVCQMAQLLQELEWLQQSVEYEEAAEHDDASKTPDALKQVIATLGGILNDRCQEETGELLNDQEMLDYGELLEMAHRPRGLAALTKRLGDKAPKYLTKIGAKHSKADQGHFDAAHDHITKGLGMDIACNKDMEYAARVDGLTKALEKAGARHSKATAETLIKCHDMLKDAGAKCPGGGADCASLMDKDAADDAQAAGASQAPKDGEPKPKQVSGEKGDPADKVTASGDLAKALAEEKATNADLQKKLSDQDEMMTKASGQIEELTKRVKELASMPLPHPRTLAPGTRPVTKGAEDVDLETAQKAIQTMAEKDPEALAIEMFKFAQKHPSGFVPDQG